MIGLARTIFLFVNYIGMSTTQIQEGVSYSDIDPRAHDNGCASDRERRRRGMEDDKLEHDGEDNLYNGRRSESSSIYVTGNFLGHTEV